MLAMMNDTRNLEIFIVDASIRFLAKNPDMVSGAVQVEVQAGSP